MNGQGFHAEGIYAWVCLSNLSCNPYPISIYHTWHSLGDQSMIFDGYSGSPHQEN